MKSAINNLAIEDYQREIIEFVVQSGRLIGLPKSVCEIYGYLFSTVEPSSMEQISKSLNISLGSASQGLKMLRNLGAVRQVYLSGQRKDHYEAEFNFREILTRFINDEIRSQLVGTAERVDNIESMLEHIESDKKQEIQTRLGIIRKLNKRANQVVPALSKILSL